MQYFRYLRIAETIVRDSAPGDIENLLHARGFSEHVPFEKEQDSNMACILYSQPTIYAYTPKSWELIRNDAE